MYLRIGPGVVELDGSYKRIRQWWAHRDFESRLLIGSIKLHKNLTPKQMAALPKDFRAKLVTK
jgi:hypothetical protein